jgi:tetraacyldisaccharide 4'-kinase
VRLDEPQWWYGETPDRRQRLLTPIAHLYGWIVEARFRRQRPYRSRLPVICVGNFTAGGAGKTPLALFIAQQLRKRGESPTFLTRGFGGTIAGPAWVEDTPDAAHRFGDEPLLLARVAPTIVARDRKAGLKMIEDGGREASVVIMDDGLQNPALIKDLSIAVVDGRRGVGNGEVIPAGPLRAPLEFQLGLIDAIVVRTPDAGKPTQDRGVHQLLRHTFPGPVLAARALPSGDTTWVKKKPIVAYAGIANPDRFFKLLDSLGAHVVQRIAFPDHHAFSRADAVRLLERAQVTGARLVTTEKDWVRLKGSADVRKDLQEKTEPFAIELVFATRDLDRLSSLLEGVLERESLKKRP